MLEEHLYVVRGLREEEITGLLNTGWRDSVRDVIGEGAAAVGAGLVGFGRVAPLVGPCLPPFGPIGR
jgi:hypothetical protein